MLNNQHVILVLVMTSVFLQDNDPKHKAKDVMEFMEKKGWDI